MLEKSRKYYLYNQPVDMRKGFNGLGGLVINKMKCNLLDGSGYVFINKKRTHLKLLVFEEDGFSIYYKRLERGTFSHPDQGETGKISYDRLLMVLRGIEVEKVRKKNWYKMPKIR
jgi:transposase